MTYISEDEGGVGEQPVSVSEIRALLGDERWARLAERLGFEVEHRAEIPPEAWPVWGIDEEVAGEFDGLEVLAAAPSYRLLLVRGGAEFRGLRRMMLGVRRVNPEDMAIWWWVRGDDLSVAVVDERPDGRPFVRRMDVDTQEPDPVGLQQLVELDLRGIAGDDLVDRAKAHRRHVGAVLEQEGLTREFFRRFEKALELLCEKMEHGPSEERDRHDAALATLLRLVFLYFLQIRGALDGDRSFVLRWLRQARSVGQEFYGAVLRPLFFGALNCPTGSREQPAKRLGELPFLNGGLFEPLPVERDYPEMSWPDEVFDEIIEELLERYHFAVEEMQGPDEQRAVDPEMLGRVFEGLMYGESRQTSGSFYTPRDVVRKLVDEAIGGYLEDATGLAPGQIAQVLEGAAVDLDNAARAKLREALASVRILDPAVGTGAFLLEALQVLRRCHGSLSSEDTEDDPLAEYRRVRELIHEHLFGVDIQHTAVRLCELRLWLALLTTLPAMPVDELPALPNLSHKVCVGNSLLSPIDLVSLRSGAGSFVSWSDGLDALDGESAGELVGELERTQREYLTTHGPEKARVRSEMAQLEERLQRTMLEARKHAIAAKLEPIEALADSRDLFGEDVELNAAQRRERAALAEELAALDEAIEALGAGRQARLSFSYAARFGQLLPRGGFDVVITNPPWVRAHRIDASQKKVLQSRYRCHRRVLWPSAKAAGIRAPFGPQVDMSALFVERSLELLRPGGRLCGLVPAKLFSSLHGTALREELAEHALVSLEDYSDADRQMFDATVYPAMVHVKKRAPKRRSQTSRASRQPKPVRLSVWRGGRRSSWEAQPEEIFSAAGEAGAPWVMAEPSVATIFEQMREVSVPLGEVDALQPQRGMFTGCNDVFLHEPRAAHELLGPHFEEFSRPVLSGRDVRPWSVDCERRILWPYGPALELRRDLPECLRRYFAGHAERLESRSDHRKELPIWQMFRVKEGLLAPKVVWRDMSPKLEAALAPSEIVPLNTVYFIGLSDERQARLLAALMNSPPLRAIAYALGERARGGWRRHFAWVMRMLPVPRRFVDFLEACETGAASDFEELFDLERRIRVGEKEAATELAKLIFELSDAQVNRLHSWQQGDEFRLGEVG
ncbi:MAG: Eco57I restriction-modification methylase domain-containing protein [Persicimonas sp.]